MIVYIDIKFGLSPPNTQIAILRDLAFFNEWKLLKAERDSEWVQPEVRIARNASPLSKVEIADFARWCQRNASDLTNARHRQSKASNIRAIASGHAVESLTANRKLRYCLEYLIWLIESLIPEVDESAKVGFQAGSVLVRRLRRDFGSHVSAEKKYLPPASLTATATKELRQAATSTPQTSFERRDQLIIRLLLEGIRVGELLKIRTHDIDERTEIDSGEYCATVKIQRRPNDPEDGRSREPAVKTLSGLLPIETKLAELLIDYITDERSKAVEQMKFGAEHCLLFVSHEGPTIGQPLSQRSINRIVAKYKGIGCIPSDLSPHVLRHTHMTEVEEILAKKGVAEGMRRDTLLNRGRWSRNSTMPSHYTGREHLRQSAAIVKQRDTILYAKE